MRRTRLLDVVGLLAEAMARVLTDHPVPHTADVITITPEGTRWRVRSPTVTAVVDTPQDLADLVRELARPMSWVTVRTQQ